MKNKLLILFTFIALSGTAQVGCTSAEIQHKEGLFKTCTVYPEFLYTELKDNSAVVIFNLEKDICTHVTVITIPSDSSEFSIVNLTKAFLGCSINFYSSLSIKNRHNVYIMGIPGNFRSYRPEAAAK